MDYYLLIPIVFGSFLGYLILRKKIEKQHKPSIAYNVFTFLWTNMLCILFFLTLPELLNNSYAYLFYPKYEAEIVDIKSRYKWVGHKSRMLMHTPIVKFKLEDSSDYVEIPLNINSGEKPELSTTIKVAYKNNSIYQLSKSGYLFFAGNALLVLGLFYPLLYSVFYISNRNTTYLKTIGVRSVIYIAVLGLIIFVVIIFKTIID